jgi:hydroxymethylpyrimidine/phosphomethylpyrimidine kinase
MIQPCCLTIAGSDSGGNAGINADLRTFHAYHLHGCSVLAALTAQNPFTVTAIHPVPTSFILAQLHAILDVYNIRALKTGMLNQPEAIEAIATTLQNYPHILKVIDPVMVATSGVQLITNTAIDMLKRRLLPMATIITPNRPEAEVLIGKTITDTNVARDVVKQLYDTYGATIILKGGHFGDEVATDLFYDGSQFATVSAQRIINPISTHGTGCTFAAALTAELALGRSLLEAFKGAKQHVHNTIQKAFYVGESCGVLGFHDET